MTTFLAAIGIWAVVSIPTYLTTARLLARRSPELEEEIR